MFVLYRCSAAAKLQCPKCKEFGMPHVASVFCSQECFRDAWAQHKQLHKPSPATWMYVTDSGKSRQMQQPEFAWTGSLRPYRCASSVQKSLSGLWTCRRVYNASNHCD